jgi:hypothetical protein
LLQRNRYWLYAIVLLSVFGAAGYAFGEATYDPPSRLPQLSFSTRDPLYGANTDVASELDALRATLGDDGAVGLEPYGVVFSIPLPRTLADRLFAERDEAATIFAAQGPGGSFRFLLISGSDSPAIFAVEAPFSRSSPEQPAGVFLAINPGDVAFDGLRGAVEAMLPGLVDLDQAEVSPDDVYIFGPYQRGDGEVLRGRIEGNMVMTYLAEGIEAGNGGVSLVAPLFIVAGGPGRGTIEGIYHPARRAIMEPLWGTSSTTTLAHELVHAYLATVAADRPAILATAADYLERAHPVLHGQVVGDLYQRLCREARAEESLAFITGAIAARQTHTVASQRILENAGYAAISEAILYSDFGLLVQLGLLPPCMTPPEGATGEIERDFYDELDAACW